jgi:hypothetical protein
MEAAKSMVAALPVITSISCRLMCTTCSIMLGSIPGETSGDLRPPAAPGLATCLAVRFAPLERNCLAHPVVRRFWASEVG